VLFDRKEKRFLLEPLDEKKIVCMTEKKRIGKALQEVYDFLEFKEAFFLI